MATQRRSTPTSPPIRGARQQVAAGCAVDVAQRQAVDLVLDVGPEAGHRPLHDTGEDEAAFRDALTQYRAFERKFAQRQELSHFGNDQEK